eukprot:CAMPEP_0178971982 /NCGR_PEP_ID=MMETSP0789-20121207/20680_1 /TAXON_ID=3005 /ORGANISM="Rhizosolenia setigera, Strain CCMP 1694" /LENGTH=453 /DNA_ID=CAMNT_0020659219 /DNA_START=69 /DNA_END=1430 /DNA_ORIENTATION=-
MTQIYTTPLQHRLSMSSQAFQRQHRRRQRRRQQRINHTNHNEIFYLPELNIPRRLILKAFLVVVSIQFLRTFHHLRSSRRKLLPTTNIDGYSITTMMSRHYIDQLADVATYIACNDFDPIFLHMSINFLQTKGLFNNRPVYILTNRPDFIKEHELFLDLNQRNVKISHQQCDSILAAKALKTKLLQIEDLKPYKKILYLDADVMTTSSLEPFARHVAEVRAHREVGLNAWNYDEGSILLFKDYAARFLGKLVPLSTHWHSGILLIERGKNHPGKSGVDRCMAGWGKVFEHSLGFYHIIDQTALDFVSGKNLEIQWELQVNKDAVIHSLMEYDATILGDQKTNSTSNNNAKSFANTSNFNYKDFKPCEIFLETLDPKFIYFMKDFLRTFLKPNELPKSLFWHFTGTFTTSEICDDSKLDKKKRSFYSFLASYLFPSVKFRDCSVLSNKTETTSI